MTDTRSLANQLATAKAPKLAGDTAKLAKALAERLAPLLEAEGVTADQLGRLQKAEVGTYQAITKDNDGVAHLHDLQKASIVLHPQWMEGPDWPVVQPADPIRISTSRRKPAERRPGIRVAAILPDAQMSFRMMGDGTLVPTHDDAAQDVALQVAVAAKADDFVDLGDFFDFPEMSTKFVQAPEFSLTTNAAVTAGYRLWAARCASLPWAKRYLIEGNHDARLANMVVRNAAAALRIRPGDAPGHWPVLSVPNLLRLDELGVTYVGGYPAGEVLLSTSFVAHHGRTVNSSGSTAAKVVQSAQQCTVFGHIHRLEVQPSVIRDPSTGGWRRIWAASAGTLARVDGHVPSYGSAEDAFGAPVPTWHENWTQGMLLVEYAADGSWVGWPEIIEIDHGRATWRGQEFTSDGDVPWRIDSLADIRPGLAEAADKHNSRSRKAR